MPDPLEPTRRSEPIWLEPCPDTFLEGIADSAPGPEARYEARESLALAFVSGLQRLPPRQRAVLVLRDVLGFRSAEVADMLQTTETAVKGALQRAREALEGGHRPSDRDRAPLPGSARERTVVADFTRAVESGDIDSIVTLLTDDAWVTMPPQPFEYQGHAAIATFLRQRAHLRGQPLRLAATRANGQPAFGCYLPAGVPPIARAYGLTALTLAGDRISDITWFFDTSLFPRFGLPPTLPGQ